MKIKPTKLIISSLLLLPLAQGAIIARYTFDGNVNDSVGTANGTPTTAGTFTEAPLFIADIPTGAISGAPTNSMEVGMTNNTLKSGFTTPTLVFSPAQGGISFWMKADTLENQDYLFTTSISGDMGMLAASATTLRTRADANSTLIDATVSAGVWNHVAVSWDNDIDGTNGSHKFFLNGSEITPTDGLFTAGGLGTQGFRIGSFNFLNNNTNLTNQFDGHIYDFQFYDTEITASNASFLFSNPGAVIPEPTTSTLAGLLFALSCMRRRRTA